LLNCSKLPQQFEDDFSSQNSSTCSPVFDNTFGDSIDSCSNWRHTEEIVTSANFSEGGREIGNELLTDRIAEETGRYLPIIN